MTTIRQLIQTTPATANELFSKLVDTSATAVKTRERLFGELKAELELLANLEEQHLFPVLRKHKDLKDLVREALNDNKATRKLLTELDNTPRDSDEFGARVAELRKVFQQHVRDEKKELLPAILEALTDDEAESVVQNIEAELAEVEEAKRAEAEERRAEARREREKLEAEQARLEEARLAEARRRRATARVEREAAEQVEAASETLVDAARSGSRAAQRTATAAEEALRNGVSATSSMLSGGGQQAREAFEAVHKHNQEIATHASNNLHVMVDAAKSFTRDGREISASYLAATQERMATNVAGVTAILASRTLPEFFAAQSALFRKNVELTIASRTRIAEVAARSATKKERAA
ncbi:MAG: hypothetical protein JWN93_773 [Hyphomicrobiales bacterium]|nr:hypothetical protein [Hyphomicrobiales bacterium]